MKVGDGAQARFWHNFWMGEESLKILFLDSSCYPNKKMTILRILESGKIGFGHRDLDRGGICLLGKRRRLGISM